LLSDTHAYWDEKFAHYFAGCDEIWHAGDIGSEGILNKLQALKPVRAVYGNIDSHLMREIYAHPPKLFVCGHSHILKVQYDKNLQMLCVNPGAAGKYGFHTVRTIMRFAIDGKEIKDMEVIELK
jgi:predicted phosphodiesterase